MDVSLYRRRRIIGTKSTIPTKTSSSSHTAGVLATLLSSIQRVLAIPTKRVERNLVTFLTDDEVDAVLAACDRSTWTGRKDHTMILLAVQTGLRVSELISLTCDDVTLGVGAHVHCIGKGRGHPSSQEPSPCSGCGSPSAAPRPGRRRPAGCRRRAPPSPARGARCRR